MIKLFRYLKLKEWLYFLISLVFIVAQVFLDLKLPDYMSRITMLVETSGSAMGDIWSAGGMMLLCSLGSLASSITVCFLAARIAASYSKRLRAEMFNKVESFSLEEINEFYYLLEHLEPFQLLLLFLLQHFWSVLPHLLNILFQGT